MRIAGCLILVIFLYGCSPISKSALKKSFVNSENKFHDHTGFVLYDLEKEKTIFDYNGAQYFTPASNTKIFTFYTSLKILGDSIPAFNYVETIDSLILWGTGDPAFLYKNVFNNNRVFDFLKSTTKPLFLSVNNFQTDHFGAGWAWDDYNSNYSAERSGFPVYGNIFTVKLWSPIPEILPTYFRKYYSVGDQKEKPEISRDVFTNNFKIHPGKSRSKTTEWDVPIRVEKNLTAALLSDTLNKTVTEINKVIPSAIKTFYGIPADSLYKVMMQESDNFIAEQLLLMSANALSDTLKPEIAIKYAKENFLKDLPDEPIWVDGSGLSRYNLFTPRSIVKLWRKIYETVPRERLLPLLATGGKNGTVKNWYKAEQPYIFGKTGSLSNNHCLSGYLVTKSGKTLVFSFMNSNYVTSTSEIRKNMQEILYNIYQKY